MSIAIPAVKRREGFTIVELLIVIVVIGILAAITIVAYNGIQQRANNSKTISAVSQWVKILNLYKADNGAYPSGITSCLGTGYGKGFSGSDASGGECRQDTAAAGALTVNSSFIGLMSPYLRGDGPTPAFVTAGSASYPWYRGAYYYASVPARIDFVLSGSGTGCQSVGQSGAMDRIAYSATDSVRCIAWLE